MHLGSLQDLLNGAVGGAAVDYQCLHVTGIVLRQHTIEAGSNACDAVLGENHHGDRHPSVEGWGLAARYRHSGALLVAEGVSPSTTRRWRLSSTPEPSIPSSLQLDCPSLARTS